jgi:hypothetical protein
VSFTLAQAILQIRPDMSGVRSGVIGGAKKAGEEAGALTGSSFGQRFGEKAKSSVGGHLKDLAKLSAGALVPLGLAAAVGQIAKIGMAYEDNLNIFQSVSKATGAQMGQVAAKARQLGADVKLPGVSAAGAAEAMTELAKSGCRCSSRWTPRGAR